MPIELPPPARFSMMTFCPRPDDICCAMSRPMVSIGPPGGKGRIILIGRVG
jgi:hypothetical protein